MLAGKLAAAYRTRLEKEDQGIRILRDKAAEALEAFANEACAARPARAILTEAVVASQCMSTVTPKARLLSLDIFRGATMASMILVNNPGSDQYVYAPLEHKEWHGWTFTDTVFPFFLWIVGVAMTLSTAKRIERGEDKTQLLRHAVRRAVILFLIGFLLGPLPDINWATIRIPGVLQRIAVCYLIATAIFLWTKWKGQLSWIIGLNALYWGLMAFYPVPGCGAGSLVKGCNFATYVDSLVLTGHMWPHTKSWDPEGIVSTIPAITTVLFGILAGHVLRQWKENAARLKWFFGAGAALMALGWIFDIWLPINKNLWTTSYAVFMAGLAGVWLGIWYWAADMRGWGRWLKPLEIFGMNAILIYVLSGVLARVMGRTGAGPWFYENILLSIASPINASMLYGVSNVLALYVVAWLLWRKGWFVKF